MTMKTFLFSFILAFNLIVSLECIPVGEDGSSEEENASLETTTQMASNKAEEYLRAEITKQWDGTDIRNADNPVELRVSVSEDGKNIIIEIDAPYFNDEPKPMINNVTESAPVGNFYGLWDYEVAEIFFLGADERYLELEFGPHGQYLVLLLDGVRNAVAHSLDITSYKVSIDEDKQTWSGRAEVPLSLFPPSVTKFNAYAIHNDVEKNDREYQSYFEVPGEQADFHRIQYFGDIAENWAGNSVLGDIKELSNLWKKSIEDRLKEKKIDVKATETMEVAITKQWDGSDVSNLDNPVVIRAFASTNNDAVIVEIEAPYFNDEPKPMVNNGTEPAPNGSFYGLWDYEVAEMFFLGDNDRYTELEFGPHGQYLVLFLDGVRNAVTHSLDITSYEASIDENAMTWRARAKIPLTYFPPGVTKFNAYAIHNLSEEHDREYQSYFEVPGEQADFHRIQYFGPIPESSDLVPLFAGVTELSEIWKDAIENPIEK